MPFQGNDNYTTQRDKQMKLDQKGEFDEDKPSNPRIEEAYYWTELDEVIDYDRDDARGLILKFRIIKNDAGEEPELKNDFDLDRTDGDVILPFFAPANLSKSEDAMSSRLTEHLEKLGLHESVLQIIGDGEMVEVQVDMEDGEPVTEEMSVEEAVLDDHISLKADSEEAADEFRSALNAVLAGKKIRVGVEDSEDKKTGNVESQVAKFSRVHSPEKSEDQEEAEEQEESESDEAESDSDALFDEESDEAEAEDESDFFDDENQEEVEA